MKIRLTPINPKRISDIEKAIGKMETDIRDGGLGTEGDLALAVTPKRPTKPCKTTSIW